MVGQAPTNPGGWPALGGRYADIVFMYMQHTKCTILTNAMICMKHSHAAYDG